MTAPPKEDIAALEAQADRVKREDALAKLKVEAEEKPDKEDVKEEIVKLEKKVKADKLVVEANKKEDEAEAKE